MGKKTNKGVNLATGGADYHCFRNDFKKISNCLKILWRKFQQRFTISKDLSNFWENNVTIIVIKRH